MTANMCYMKLTTNVQRILTLISLSTAAQFKFMFAEETDKWSEVLLSALEAVNDITFAYRNSDIYLL